MSGVVGKAITVGIMPSTALLLTRSVDVAIAN